MGTTYAQYDEIDSSWNIEEWIAWAETSMNRDPSINIYVYDENSAPYDPSHNYIAVIHSSYDSYKYYENIGNSNHHYFLSANYNTIETWTDPFGVKHFINHGSYQSPWYNSGCPDGEIDWGCGCGVGMPDSVTGCDDGGIEEPVDPDEIDPDEIEEPEDIPDEPEDLPKDDTCPDGKIKDVYDNCVECKEKTSEGDCKTCEEGSVMNTDGKCVEDCDEIKGYVHKVAFNGKAPTETGLQHTTKTDNFRDENRALIKNNDVDCNGNGKMPQGASINITSTTEVTLGGVGGYFAATFKKCEQGNLPDNLKYDKDKPCADSCGKGNPLKNMKIQGTQKNINAGTNPVGGSWASDARMYANGTYKWHKGFDLAGKEGDPIYAAHAGKVVRIEDNHPNDVDKSKYQDAKGNFNWKKYVAELENEDANNDVNKGGNRVYIEFTDKNGHTYQEWYMHLSEGSIDVKLNDTVNIGDKIAEMGNTGNAQSESNGGTHLHYQIYDPSKSKGTTSEMYPNPKDFIYGDMQDDGTDNNKCDK